MPNVHAYERAQSLEEALFRLAEEPRTVPLAGGTALMAYGVPREDAILLDISALPFDMIELWNDRLVLGALVSLETMARDETLRTFAGGVLAEAAHAEATSLLRQQGRLAGALLTDVGHSEIAPVLLALDAQVSIQQVRGLKTWPLATFFAQMQAALGRGVLVQVDVPRPLAETQVRRERVARAPRDRAILSVVGAVRLAQGRIAAVRLAAAGVEALPVRLHAVETALLDEPVDPSHVQALAARAVAQMPLADDRWASAAYRREVLPVLVRRVVCGA